MSVTSVVNPATEQVIADVPQTPLEEVDAAIERASSAFEGWRQVAPADRARLLRRFAEAVDADREQLAQLEVRNSGHTIANARWEAGNVRDVLNYYSAAPKDCSDGRSRCRAASTSRSKNRWASSGLSCPGTSRCRSRAGAWHRRWRPGTPSF